MKETIKVLDNGFVRLVEYWGKGDADINEAAIIEAARQSTQGSFRGDVNTGAWHQADEKLLDFMFKNKHATPFEFCGLTLEMKMPIFVIRELHRHRTFGYNEMSARYAPLPDENYMPTLERLFLTQKNNKQAQAVDGAKELSEEDAKQFLQEVATFYEYAQGLYEFGLDAGVPKEVARIVLPVGRYTQQRMTGNLRNYLGLLILRQDYKAQYEIRMFANAIAEIIAEIFPRTYRIFEQVREIMTKADDEIGRVLFCKKHNRQIIQLYKDSAKSCDDCKAELERIENQ